MWKNVRFAFRRLMKTPSFSVLSIATLGVGLAFATTAFILVQTILVRPLPYREPERLVRVLAFDQREGQLEWLSWAEATALHRESRSFEDTAVSTVFPATLREESEDERVQRSFVSPNYFRLLGVEPILGSLFVDGGEGQALVSEGLWRRRWSARPDIVGRSVRLNDELRTIVGVLPSTAYTHDLGSAPAEVWLAQRLDDTGGDPHFRIYTVVGRLVPDATEADAESEMELIQRRLELEHAEPYRNWSARAESLQRSFVGDAGTGLVVMLGAVSIILLVVTVNLAHLMMSRYLGRRDEIATRLALGDRIAGILRDAALEGGLLASGGAVLSVLLAAATLRALPSALPFSLPRTEELEVNLSVVAASAVFALLATILFAVLPSLRIARANISEALRGAGRVAAGRGRARQSVIVAQVALSLPLLIGAALLSQSLFHLSGRDVGMEPDGLASIEVSIPNTQYREPSDRAGFFAQALSDVLALPAVESTGATLQVPMLATQADRARFRFLERPEAADDERPRALMQVVTAGYFETLGTRLVQGRMFDARDVGTSTPVAIVSRELARREFGAQSPLGLHIETDLTMTPDEPNVRQVIGVVEDIPHFGPRVDVEPQIFVPHPQSAFASMAIMMRVRAPVARVVPQVRRLLLEREPRAVVGKAVLQRDAIDRTLGQPRFYSQLLVVLALVATLLACLGLYALLTFSITARTRELGLRAALGASPGSLLRLVLSNGLSVVLVGLAAGVAIAALGAGMLRTMLYGVGPLHVPTFVAAGALLLTVSAIAAWLPAQRAARLDPVKALRSET